MKEMFSRFIINLYDDVPAYIYVLLIIVFILCVAFFIILERDKSIKYSVWLLFVEYMFLLFCSTVLYRPLAEGTNYNFIPFWSYNSIIDGNSMLIAENIMNIIVFLPIGLLLPILFNGTNWWKGVLICGCISVMIETMQLFFRRGFSEIDDIMHNMLGGMIGYGLYKLLVFSLRYVR